MATDTAATNPAGSPPARERRPVLAAVGDMGRSLGLVFAFIALLLALGPGRQLLFPSHDDAVHTVAYGPVVAAARTEMGMPVLDPVGLGPHWRATSVRMAGGQGDPVTLHVGFLTPAGRYAGVEESTGPSRPFLETQLGKSGAATVDGTRSVGGATWQLRHDAQGEPAFSRVIGGVTVVVTGSAHADEMTTLLSSLQVR